MNRENASSPSLALRGAVIVAAVALLAGVAGVLYVNAHDRASAARHPAGAATVLVHGPGPLQDVRVRALWTDAAGRERAEAARPGPEPGLWLLEQAPEGVPLTLEILRAGAPPVRQPAILTRGGIFDVRLAGR
jgi:hypothetical protein